ncbi:MAG: hypothetical protein RLY97_1419 [Pseudomonadota bacterium]|jgi:very-short-patch-repair endonuclease
MRDPRLTSFAKSMRHEMTEPETLLWLELRAERFMGIKFRRQKVIGNYIADFAANDPKLIVELDGNTHDVDDKRDQVRTNYLESQGYQVVRFTNTDVITNMDGVLTVLQNTIQELQTPPLPTLSPLGGDWRHVTPFAAGERGSQK